jgi:transcriptional regulator with XRE-family HTH domain
MARSPATKTTTKSAPAKRARKTVKAASKSAPRKKALPAPTPLVLPPAAAVAPNALKALARQLQSWTESVLGMAGTATDIGVTLAKSRLKKPQHKAAVEKAGSLLHDLRQTAGLTVQDLGRALGLSDATDLELIESGKMAMPFELILRAASVLGRKDPVTFVMQFTRAYNPEIWKALEALGIGKLVVQGAREREFANIYRAHDLARTLTDAEFAQLLAFVNASFELGLDFMKPVRKEGATANKAGPKTD